MMLTKQNVCLYIKDEEHLEEMREFLEGKGEKIYDSHFYVSYPFTYKNYLRIVFDDLWSLNITGTYTEITTKKFKKLWE